MNFNETAAEQVLNQAFSIYPVEFVCTELLQRGMSEIGSMWFGNRATVQQEHFASALTTRRLDALLLASPAPTRHQTVIVGCPANEWHTFIPLLMALLIRRRGYKVIYLGANVPDSKLAETIEAVNANLVVLASQQLNTAASLQQSAALIAKHGGQVAFGGRIFALHPDLAGRITGHYLGNRTDGAIDIIEGLLSVRSVPPQTIPTPDEYTDAMRAFNARRASIEASLDGQNGVITGAANYFPEAHKYLGDNIMAALQLGSMTYLDSEIDWLKVMIQGHNLPGKLLDDYLEAYFGVAKQLLAEGCLPVTQWFERQIQLRQK